MPRPAGPTRLEMPSPSPYPGHSQHHQPPPLPASAYNFHLNASSTSNLSATSASFSASNPTSRSTTPASQLTQLSSSRKPLANNQYPLYDPSVPASRPVYGAPYPGSSKIAHVANSASHISSAINYPSSASATPSHHHHHQQQQQQQQQQPSSQNLFPSGSLPRSSSLLPPPRITVNESNNWKQPPLHDPFHGASPYNDPVNDREVDDSVSPKNTRRRSSKTHSRSSSLGGLSDGFRNLNRWSISTASSRASNATPSRSRFSRRMSVDSTALFSQNPPVSPRRLYKSRPSTASESPDDRQPSIPPLETLPPIVPLPSLSQEDFGQAASGAQETRQDRTTYFPGPGAEHNHGRFGGDESAIFHETSYLSTSPQPTPDPTAPTSTFPREPNMPHNENGSGFQRGHSRSRSQGLKSSTDSTSSPKSRDRNRQPSQKAMLSKALQKANTAVQLDNAQNLEGARAAYLEACDLLQQVLFRTPGDDDKKKLEAIRKTYASRIEELDQMVSPEAGDSKALPQTPGSTTTTSRKASVVSTTDELPIVNRQRSDTGQSQQTVPNYARPTSAAWRGQLSHSPKPSFDGPRYVTPTPTPYDSYDRAQSSFSQRSPRRAPTADQDRFLARPMQDEYMPPPLSPRRPSSPGRSLASTDRGRLAPGTSNHQRTGSHESTSWLDPIDESGGSSVSSVHSRSSSRVRRKHIRAASGDTEAEFDAALDDAIEAAYDDGYEPATIPDSVAMGMVPAPDGDDVVAQALRKVQLAKERVRQSELEMQRLANDRDRRMKALQEEEEQTLPEGFYDGSDSDEDERILEEMTDGYAIEDFAFGDPSKSRLPRESDSSDLTSRTWQSSSVSNPPTASTVLSTVSENTTVPALAKNQGPLAPPPTQSLPKIPTQRPPSAAGGRDSVRDRRLSGQNAKQLKIETQKLGPRTAEPATAGPTVQLPEIPNNAQPKTAGYIVQQRQALTTGPSRSASLRRGPSPIPPALATEGLPPTPPVPSNFQDPEFRAASPSISRPPTLRKNFSSNSLKNMKTRNLSISNMDELSDLSPGTPNPFPATSATRLPAMPSLPTPVASAFRDRVASSSAAGGFHLFENEIHSPRSPGEPSVAPDAPLPLEPCPKETMLRPFWLMRALYQTLCHPKGGYVSNKLFVPRDAWRVKGVKIKNMEDKISQCDLLTAALQKLDRVNSEDADAVLEEMQSLETVLEQVQTFLTRRLGNDVGVQAANTLFKDADGAVEGQDGKPIPRNNSVSGKGAFSWKRLRSKTSSTTMSTTYERGATRKESSGTGTAEAMLSTLPFTDHPTSKPSKRDVMSVHFSGPNAHYMAALARLFDAAQAIDQIARQVEDPGLRLQDKTQVGLELSTRHAAEFFAFYICRFVLQDLTMLLDKFIKRGSEWVLV